jgi:uncharacterized protein
MRGTAMTSAHAAVAIALSVAIVSSASAQLRAIPERCDDTGKSVGLEALSINAINRELNTELKKAPLIYFALGKSTRGELRRMLSEKVDPNVCVAGGSLLGLSAISGDVEEVDILLDGGADPNRPKSSIGGTALHSALSFGRFDAVMRLLERGADPLVVEDGGLTCLHQLAIAPMFRVLPNPQSQLMIAKELIERGVPVNAQAGVTRGTALMFAALQGNVPLVQLLLDSGVDPNLSNTKGQTPLTFAIKRGHRDVTRVLEQWPYTRQ